MSNARSSEFSFDCDLSGSVATPLQSRHLAFLLAAHPSPGLLVDPSGVVRYANDALGVQFGGAVVGLPQHDVLAQLNTAC